MTGLPRLILLLTGVGFVGFGAAYALWPARLAAVTDLVVATPTARADFAATYGGFQIGFGLFLVAATRHTGWLEPGLWAATAALAGLVSLRTLGVLRARGRVRSSIWLGICLELLGLALNAWALAQAHG